jgi:hypothetical protein
MMGGLNLEDYYRFRDEEVEVEVEVDNMWRLLDCKFSNKVWKATKSSPVCARSKSSNEYGSIHVIRCNLGP